MKEIQILNNGDALYDIRRKINENFELVHEKATTEPLVSFGVNEGNETDGVADLLNIDGDTLNFKVGGEYPNLVMTSGDGVTTKIESVNPLHLQNLADGEYKVVVDGSNSNITNAEFYSQLLEPENANNGDVWFNGENAVQHKSGVLNISLQESTPFKVNCIASSGNSVLIAGDNNSCARSSDAGKTWETFEMGEGQSNQSFVGCVFHNNTFYLITSGGSLYTSSNLEAWSSTTLSLDGFVVTNLILVNNILVVLTNSRYILVNHSGNTWTTRQVTTNKVNDIIYFNGEYYAISGVMLFTSQNLIDWTSPNKSYPNANCLGTYNNKLLIGSTEGKLYIDDFTGNLVTKQLKSGTINAIETRPDGYFVFVGSNGVCSISNDLENFTHLDIGTTSLIRTDGEFAISSNSIIRIRPIGSWVPYPYIPIGEVTISGGEVTYFTTYPYNTNGLFEATSSTFGLLRTAAEPDELNCHCQEAVLTPANLYNLNNYRTMNTSYEVDQKVGCPYHHNLQLNCIQAGTTSNEGLNTKGLLEPGTTIEDGTVIWEVQELGTAGGGLPMFAHIWSDHIYKDASYLRADTFSWHDGRIYKTGYEILEEQYDNEDSVIEVEDGITYKRTPDGFKIADETQQDAIRSLYETKGIAWIYVIDKANKRFKLPRTKWGFVGLRDGVGNTVEAGLPNITAGGAGELGWSSVNNPTGAFTKTIHGAQNGSFNTDGGTWLLGFDASRSNPIYGNSDTVQSPATQMYLYFYIGAYKRPETELELGKITEVLNDLGDLKDVVLKKNQITNCITEIPQRIKLELNDGVLTLKAGSEVIVPNGFEVDGVTPKFDEVTIANDISKSGNVNPHCIMFYDTSFNMFNHFNIDVVFSGDTAPTTFINNYAFWYDTANNVIKRTGDGGVTWISGMSLPVCIVTSINSTQNSNIASIDQVFNGMGYIGKTIWIDKGVSYLIPHGKDRNGVLINDKVTTKKVQVTSRNAYIDGGVLLAYRNGQIDFIPCNSGTLGYIVAKNGLPVEVANKYERCYVESENQQYFHRPVTSGSNPNWTKCSDWAVVGTYGMSADKITFFQPKNTFRAVDYSDKPEISGWGMPSNKYTDLTLGASHTTYTAPANGYFYVNMVASGENYLRLTNSTANFAIEMRVVRKDEMLVTYIPVKKGDICTVRYDTTGATQAFRFIYAEGEI